MNTFKRFCGRHKPGTAVVIAIVFVTGYWGYHRATAATVQTRYVLGTVATGTIVSTVSESGQVSTSDTIDLKPQVSGTLTGIYVKAGDRVRSGQVVARIDNSDAVQSLEASRAQLATDELNYQKSSAQAPIDFKNDTLSLSNAQTQLANDYTTIYNHLTSAYLDLPSLVSGAHDSIYGSDFDTRRIQDNADALTNVFTVDPSRNTTALLGFRDRSVTDYTTARAAYDSSLAAYQKTSRSSSSTDVEQLLSLTIDTMTDTTQSLQTELNFFGTASDMAQTYDAHLPTAFSTVQSATKADLSTANSDLSLLLSDKKMLDADKQAVAKAEQQIALDQVGNPDGSNPISLQVSANSIAQEKQDIANKESDLSKYVIVAPFSGIIATVSAHAGDSAGGSAIASMVSDTQIAKLSLNEIDAAKVKLGNPVSLTFDAIDGLTIKGTVATIDPVGTVTQGVVSYEVDISFDSQDSRVKPGMTVNADIETGSAKNALVIPAAAVSEKNGKSFVMVVDSLQGGAASSTVLASEIKTKPTPVVVGISDDTNIQILSGLSAGDRIVVTTRSGAPTASSGAARTGTARGGFGGGGQLRGL